jgi:hypothetical protein
MNRRVLTRKIRRSLQKQGLLKRAVCTRKGKSAREKFLGKYPYATQGDAVRLVAWVSA